MNTDINVSKTEWMSFLSVVHNSKDLLEDNRQHIVFSGRRYYTLSEAEIKCTKDIQKLTMEQINKISQDLKIEPHINTESNTWSKTFAYYSSYFFQLSDEEIKEKAIQKIAQQISRIPEMIKQLNDEVTDADRIEMIKQRMKDDYPPAGQTIVPQFLVDIKRGCSILRKDMHKKINDQSPQPPRHLNEDDKITWGLQAIRDLTNKGNDQRWDIPLQLVSNQTTLNNIFDGVSLKFTLDVANHDVCWSDQKTGERFRSAIQFSNGMLPPVILNIFRNETHGEIEKVYVEVQGNMDVVQASLGKSTTPKIILKDAIECHLGYLISLDQQNHPIIETMHSYIVSKTSC